LLSAALNIQKVAGLARRVHDSATLQEKLEKLIAVQPKPSGQKRTLTRHVPTRWNSDLACLASHVELETPVKQLTSDTSNQLGKYALNRQQWNLAKELTEVLEVCLWHFCKTTCFVTHMPLLDIF
jgi:hypothetical protein